MMRLLPVLAIPAVLSALVLVFMIVIFGGIDTAAASDFDHQCDVAIPNSSTTVPASTSRSARTGSVSPPPTENPYAQLTFAPDDDSVSDRQRACATAMRTAVYQEGPPLSEPATGAAARCAAGTIAALASQGSRSGAGTADDGGAVDSAAVMAAVTRRASTATGASGCLAPADTEIDALLTTRSGRDADRCPLPGAQPIVDLPDDLAAQSLCGQLVEAAAVSPGDLVFWDYRGNAPTRVGMVVDAGQLSGARTGAASVVVVSWDPNSGTPLRLGMPSGWDVRVKRVLGDSA